MENTVKTEHVSFGRRLKSMLNVDFRRMCRSKLLYILLACALLIPILMTVMMAMMDGTVSVDPQTGEKTVMVGPENTWQNIGTLPGGESMGGSDIFMLCNINMMFMAVAVFICLFISEDFRSGYAKNLFTVRAKKSDYVMSKTLVGFVCGALMLILYLLGSMLGGAIAGLSFELHGLNCGNILLCMIAKISLMLVFVAIDVLVSVAAKQKAGLCLCGSLGIGMLFFMTVSMITPLGATFLHALLCFCVGVLFAVGLGAAGNAVLKKTALV